MGRQPALRTSRGGQYTCSEHCRQASSATCGSVGKPSAPLQHPKLTALPPVVLRYQLIPGVHREIYEICALPGYYASYSCNSLSAIRDYLAVPPSRVECSSVLLRGLQWQFLIGVSRLPSGPTFKGQEGSSGFLRGVQWQFLVDVSGLPSGPTFKGQGALLGYYAAYSGKSLSTFRDNISALLEDGNDRFPEMSASNYHCTLCRNPEKRRSVGSEAVRLQLLAIHKSTCLISLPLQFHFTILVTIMSVYLTSLVYKPLTFAH